MVAPKKAKKQLEHSLVDLAHWITAHSVSPNHPKETSTKNVENFVTKLEKQIGHFVQELTAQQHPHERVAAEFKVKCDSLQRAIAESLQSHDNSQATTNALKHLHKVIVDALTQLSKIYREVFKSAALSPTPAFTPHHGQQVVHLANEQRYKVQASRGPQTDNLRHYNIPPGKKG